MRTADVSKFLLAVFERPYDGLYISYFLWLQNVSIKKNYTSASNIEPWKTESKMGSMLYESTYQSGPFTDIPAHSTV